MSELPEDKAFYQYVPKARLDETVRWLCDLLATIHRDGGQHTGKVGLERSVEDAIQVWAALMQRAEALDSERAAAGLDPDGGYDGPTGAD